MGKILIFMFEGMADYEVTFISHLLHADAGKEIMTIAYTDDAVEGQSGIHYQPQYTVKEVLKEDVEGLILCGGWNNDIRLELVELIQRIHKERKLLAGICSAGTVMLAKAGVLDYMTYTTPISKWSAEEALFYNMDDPFPRENYVSKRLVRDRHVITAQGIAFVDFALEICAWFKLFQSQQEKHEFSKLVKGH